MNYAQPRQARAAFKRAAGAVVDVDPRYVSIEFERRGPRGHLLVATSEGPRARGGARAIAESLEQASA